jgi:hypothetical protein
MFACVLKPISPAHNHARQCEKANSSISAPRIRVKECGRASFARLIYVLELTRILCLDDFGVVRTGNLCVHLHTKWGICMRAGAEQRGNWVGGEATINKAARMHK